MSFFGGDQKQGSANAWGGFFKQAISSVETRFDSLLDQDAPGSSNKNNADAQMKVKTFTDTYVDPDSGMVTTIQRKRPKASAAAKSVDSTKAPESPKSDSQGKLSNTQPASRSATDLSARLAAVMSEKAGRSPSPSNSGRSTPKPMAKDTISPSQTKPSSEKNVEKDGDVSKPEEQEQPLVETSGKQAIVDIQQDIPSGEAEKELEPTATDNAPMSPEENESQGTEPEQTEDSKIPIAEVEEKQNVEDTKPQPLLEPTTAALEDNVPKEHETMEAMDEDKMDVDSTETSTAYETSAANVENEEEQPSEDVDSREAKDETIVEPAVDNSDEAIVPVEDTPISVPKEDSTSSANEDEKWNAIIRQREEQVLSVMKSNAELHEQLHQLQDTSDAEISRLKAKIDELMSSKSGNKAVEELRSQLAGKDTQIQGLMAEGEALSKRELKHMNALKKLRADKQESEKSLQDLQKKIDKGSSDLIEANAKVARMTEAEKKNSESLKNANIATNKQQKTITRLEKTLEDTKNELKASQAQLEQVQKELTDAKESGEKEASAAHAAALEKELKANDRLHKELTETQTAAEETEEKLKKNIRELQIAIQTIEEKAGYREDNLRKDIARLQQRLQAAEAYADEVHSNMDDSTQPLLRQIEVLQTKINEMTKSRDEMERRFSSELEEAKASNTQSAANEAQLEISVSQYSERVEILQKQVHDLQQRLDTSEKQLAAEKLASADMAKKLSGLENDLKMMDEQHSRSLDDERRRYEQLAAQQLEEAKEKWEELARQERLRATSLGSPLGRSKRQNSFVANWVNENTDESRTNRLAFDQSSPATSNRSSFDSSPHMGPVTSSAGPPTIVIERLNATIRQLEGQNQLYQVQAQQSAQSRDELAEELVKLSHDVDKLREESKTADKLKAEHEELNQRYHAALEMLGERTEQVEELRADISDVKEMYRSQIVELVQKIDLLSKS
ncbi:unnamed protein product [Umbelopsis ramanniana]